MSEGVSGAVLSPSGYIILIPTQISRSFMGVSLSQNRDANRNKSTFCVARSRERAILAFGFMQDNQRSENIHHESMRGS